MKKELCFEVFINTVKDAFYYSEVKKEGRNRISIEFYNAIKEKIKR